LLARKQDNNEQELSMKLTTLTVAVAAIMMFAQSASAREHHHRHGQHHRVIASRATNGSGREAVYRGRNRGRPAAWCGWEMRRLVGADPGPSFNLARNWAHWGRPGPVGVGAVIVWPHHVGKIVGRENGEWVVESGNDSHALRTRPRSIAGAIAIRWG
jgi:hypothetical protein